MKIQFFIRRFLHYVNKKFNLKEDLNSLNLEESGFVKINNFLNIADIKKILPNLEIIESKENKKLFLKRLYKNYQNINHENIDIRGIKNGIDHGIIDIKMPDDLSNEDILKVRNYKKLILKINKLLPKNYSFSHFNIYIYRNCIKPRCLHIDSIKAKHLKAFIYLTNSLVEDGLYSYVKGSNNNIFYNSFQYLLNLIFGSDMGVGRTDGTLYTIDKITKFKANIGDLIVTDQRGVHGDLPMIKKDSGKVVLVVNFMINKKYKNKKI